MGTGTFAWYYRIVIEQLLGLESGFDGITVNPQLPAEWNTVSIRLPFRGSVYKVEIRKEKSAKQTTVLLNGKLLPGNRIPVPAKNALHKVLVSVPA